jgi:hypothetical protein
MWKNLLRNLFTQPFPSSRRHSRKLLLAGAPDGSLPMAFQALATGSDGNDQIHVGIDSPIFLGAANVRVVALGGLGNDIVTVEGVDGTGDLYGNDRAHFNITASGGDGQDQIHVLVGSVNQPPDPELRLDWNLVVTGDAGNDIVARNVLLAAGPRRLDAGGVPTPGGWGRRKGRGFRQPLLRPARQRQGRCPGPGRQGQRRPDAQHLRPRSRLDEGVNDAGNIVGWGVLNSGAGHAFLMTPLGRCLDHRDLVTRRSRT